MLFICSGYPNLYVLMPYRHVLGAYMFRAAESALFILFSSFQMALFMNQRYSRAESAHPCSLPSRPCAVDRPNLDYAVLISKLTSGQSSTRYYDAMSITPGLSRKCLWLNIFIYLLTTAGCAFESPLLCPCVTCLPTCGYGLSRR